MRVFVGYIQRQRMASDTTKILQGGRIARRRKGLETQGTERQRGKLADAGGTARDQHRSGKQGIYHLGINIHFTLRHLSNKGNRYLPKTPLRHEGYQWPVARQGAMP